MEKLDSYDLKECFGINLRKIQKTSSANNGSYTKVHLVRLKPRLDIIDRLSPRSLIEFRFLVTQMMHKRSGLVTTFLDRFFDSYREDLAPIGINNSTKSGQLSREQYLELFLYLNNRPDYKGSTFLQAVAGGEEIVLSL